jgi:hypothetical protein
MNIELRPKYKIGDQFKEDWFLKNEETGENKVFTRRQNLVITNIRSTYDYKTDNIEYKYELTEEKDGHTYVRGWTELE